VPKRILSALILPLLALPVVSRAQDQVRPSNVAGRLFRPVSFEQRDYNAKLGPVSFRVGADLRTEFNDNINLSEKDRESDVIISPEANLSAYWAITPYNALSVNLSFGYHFYLAHPELNNADSGFVIDPSTELSFDLYTGSFRINFHERPSIQQDPVGEPTLSNIPLFGRFVNTAGIGVDWAINRQTSLTSSYDHTDYIALQSQFAFADFSQDEFATTLSVRVNDSLTVGPESAISSTRYRTGDKADAFGAHAGVFAEVLLTPYTRMRVAGGYQTLQFDGNNTVDFVLTNPNSSTTQGRLFRTDNNRGDNGDDNTYYFNFLLTNQLSRYYTHSLAIAKEAQLGITSQSVDLFSIRYASTWTLNRFLTIQTHLLFDKGEESGAVTPDHFLRFGANVATDIQLTRKLHLAVGYDFIRKDSDSALQSYTRNMVFTEFHFAF
jgi:hypothetical protein